MWVDPLDGTAEYTEGSVHSITVPCSRSTRPNNCLYFSGLLESVTVLIGIAVGSKAMAGVIYQPYHGPSGRTVWGIVGLGAYGYTPNQLPNDCVIVTTSRRHSSAVVEEAISAMNPIDVLRVGGAGYKVCARKTILVSAHHGS